MTITNEEINKLNELLDGENQDINELDKLLITLKQEKQMHLQLIDLTYYNLALLQKASMDRVLSVKFHNFEMAAFNRNLEKRCREFIQLQSHFGVEKSQFQFHDGKLIYFHLGTSKNEDVIIDYFNNKFKYD